MKRQPPSCTSDELPLTCIIDNVRAGQDLIIAMKSTIRLRGNFLRELCHDFDGEMSLYGKRFCSDGRKIRRQKGHCNGAINIFRGFICPARALGASRTGKVAIGITPNPVRRVTAAPCAPPCLRQRPPQPRAAHHHPTGIRRSRTPPCAHRMPTACEAGPINIPLAHWSCYRMRRNRACGIIANAAMRSPAPPPSPRTSLSRAATWPAEPNHAPLRRPQHPGIRPRLGGGTMGARHGTCRLHVSSGCSRPMGRCRASMFMLSLFHVAAPAGVSGCCCRHNGGLA